MLSHLLALPLMSLCEQCGLPVRTIGDAAVAQAVVSLLVRKLWFLTDFQCLDLNVWLRRHSSSVCSYFSELLEAEKAGDVTLVW